MTAFDYAVLAIVGLSVAVAIWRGVVREVIALAAWVGAFFVANGFAADFAPMLPDELSSPQLRYFAAFAGVFLFTLLIMSLVAIVLGHLVRAAGLGAVDRGLGVVFGLARGVFIVTMLVLVAGLTTMPRQGFWRNAMLSPPLEALALSIKPWLPPEMAQRIRYD